MGWVKLDGIHLHEFGQELKKRGEIERFLVEHQFVEMKSIDLVIYGRMIIYFIKGPLYMVLTHMCWTSVNFL